MLYVRYANRQARYSLDEKTKAFSDIVKLGLTEFDIYNSDSKSVIFGAYRITSFAGDSGTESFYKNLNQARKAWSSVKDADRVLIEHYDVSDRTYGTVYDTAVDHYVVYVSYDLISDEVPPFGDGFNKVLHTYAEARAFADRVIQRAAGKVDLHQVSIDAVPSDPTGNDYLVWRLNEPEE